MSTKIRDLIQNSWFRIRISSRKNSNNSRNNQAELTVWFRYRFDSVFNFDTREFEPCSISLQIPNSVFNFDTTQPNSVFDFATRESKLNVQFRYTKRIRCSISLHVFDFATQSVFDFATQSVKACSISIHCSIIERSILIHCPILIHIRPVECVSGLDSVSKLNVQ